ncbi:hypothetical protein GCM10008983_18880 [Lentibacillus halophilus]|uniref:Uncharacterized protein n=1 Tax=Lentibacillus halophilus TaxID=295065 RepID=A0ABN0ZB15_9BACI
MVRLVVHQVGHIPVHVVVHLLVRQVICLLVWFMSCGKAIVRLERVVYYV